MRMLGVEERLRRVELLFVGPKEGVKSVEVVLLRPVSADERIALHVLDPEIGIRLVEKLLPDPRRPRVVIADAVTALRKLGIVRGSPDVVIAVNEELLDLLSVETSVARKDRIPCVREDLELADAPLVGNVACDHHAVCTALAEEPERAQKMSFISGFPDVHVADEAKADFRRATAEKPRRGAERASSVEQRERAARPKKHPPRQFSVFHAVLQVIQQRPLLSRRFCSLL